MLIELAFLKPLSFRQSFLVPTQEIWVFKPQRLTTAVNFLNFVLHRTSSLKCTGVNALSFPVHFNRSVLKLLNLGTTVKRKRVRCSDFQNMLFTGVILYLGLKTIKYIRMWAWQKKRPPPVLKFGAKRPFSWAWMVRFLQNFWEWILWLQTDT